MSRVLPAVLLALLASIGPAAAAEPDASDLHPARDIDTWIDLSGSLRPVVLLCPDLPGSQGGRRRRRGDREARGRRPEVTCDPQKALPERITSLPWATSTTTGSSLGSTSITMRLRIPVAGTRRTGIRTVYDPYPWHGRETWSCWASAGMPTRRRPPAGWSEDRARQDCGRYRHTLMFRPLRHSRGSVKPPTPNRHPRSTPFLSRPPVLKTGASPMPSCRGHAESHRGSLRQGSPV